MSQFANDEVVTEVAMQAAQARTSASRRRRAVRGPNRALPAASRSFVGYLNLPKAGGKVISRSALEADVLTALQFDPAVERIERNDLTADERLRFDLPAPSARNRVFSSEHGEHTPDLRVRMRGATAYLEISPRESLADPAEWAKIQAAAVEAVDAGFGYGVIDESIRQGNLVANCRRLLGWLFPIGAEPDLTAAARRIFERANDRQSELEVAEALRGVGSHGDEVRLEAARHAIATAAASGHLIPDPYGPKIDASARFGMLDPTAPTTPSWLEEHLRDQRANPIPAPAAPLEPGTTFTIPTEHSDLTPDQLAEFGRRLALVKDKEQHPALTWFVLSQRHGISRRAARYHCRLYRLLGEAGILPVRAKTGVRIPDALATVGRNIFRNGKAQTVKALYEHPSFQARIRELGKPFSYRQCVTFWNTQLMASRLLREDAAGLKRHQVASYRGSSQWLNPPETVLELVEADETIVDCFVLSTDGRYVIRRMHLILLIDVASGCLVGWRFCEEEPTQLDYLKAARMAMQPKAALITRVHAENPFPCEGVFGTIRTDRGMIFTAARPRHLFLELGTRIEVAAPHQPTMKADVERALGVITQRLFQRLPGAQPPGNTRDAVAECRRHGVTRALFEDLFALAVIDGINARLNTSTSTTPLQRWQKLVAKNGLPKAWPNDRRGSRLSELFALIEVENITRSLDPRGYHAHGEWYLPERRDLPEEAHLLKDPDDVRRVAVTDALGNDYGEAVLQGYDLSVAISESELKELRRARRADASESNARSIATLSRIVAKAEANGPLSPKEAAKLEKAQRTKREHAHRTFPVPPIRPLVELVLDTPRGLSGD